MPNLANSPDPDETPRFAASHLGLRCLYMFPFEYIQPVPQMRTLNFRLAMPRLYFSVSKQKFTLNIAMLVFATNLKIFLLFVCNVLCNHKSV